MAEQHDTQLYIVVDPKNIAPVLQQLHDCTERVRAWFIVNHLMLNSEKSDVLLSGTPQALKKDAIKSISLINIAGINLKPSQCIKSLGVNVYKDLSFNTHIKSVVKACNCHMRAFLHL